MKVNTWYWIRAFLMFCGLVGSILAIRRLDQTRSDIPKGATVNLCPTRVRGLHAADGLAIVQDGMGWFRKTGGSHLEELDPIAVERWFGEHCRLSADMAASHELHDTTPLVTLDFVTGSPEILASAGPGVYLWMGQAFRSGELDRALTSLRALPLRLRPGR